MPFIVCDECGTKNELHSAAEPGGGAGDSYVYCRACANRIQLRPEAGAADTSAAESSGSNDLLDELLSMPLAAAHQAAHALEPEPTVAKASAEIAPAEPEVAAAPEAQAELEAANTKLSVTAETAAPSTLEVAPEIAADASAEPAPAPITTSEPAADVIAEPAAASPAMVQAAPEQVAAPVPMPVAAPVPMPAAAPMPVAVPRPIAASAAGVERTQRRSRPPPLPATEIVAAPVIAIAQSTPEPEAKPVPSALEVASRNIVASARTEPTSAEVPRAIAVEPGPVSEASVSNAEPAIRATGGAAPTRDSLDELSWELPSPMPPIARELERSAGDASAGAALAPRSAEEPALSEQPVDVRALSEQATSGPALGEQPVDEPALGEPALGEPALGEPALGEPALSEQAAGGQALGEPLVAAPSVAVQGSAGPETPLTAQQSAREVAHVALETGPANIRATLPFGPTLPSRETVPGIVTDTGVDPDEPDTTDGAIASTAPVPATTASVSAVSVASTAQPARVEPAPLPGAAASAQAAEATAPVLSRPFFAPNARTTSDAPTTQSWLPPEPSPSKLRRYAPLAAALVAVAVAFVGGIQVGKMSPNSPAPTAAAAPPTSRPPAAEVAAPPTATAVPASAGTPTQMEPTAASGTNASHTGLVALKPNGRFSAKVANAALGQVTGRARACKKPGSPGGTALAMVTFGPSGRVEDVTVSGARFAGTPVATCIASALSAARVPPFAGSAQTVKRAVKID